MKLQHLFFPTENNLSNDILVYKLVLSSSVTINKLPSIKEFKDKGKKTHTTWHPNFLTKLDDDSYYKAYYILQDNPIITIPSWHHFLQLDSGVSSVVIGILKYIMI